MGRSQQFPVKFQVALDKELHKALKAMAVKQQVSMAVLVRKILKEAVEYQGAAEGIDAVTGAVRRTIRSELKPLENRLAKITAKGAVAAATAMYMNYAAIADSGRMDVKSIYDSARKKAVKHVGERDEEAEKAILDRGDDL